MWTSAELRQKATPLTIGAFVFVGVTGVMMFFHLSTGLIKEAHEWLGIAFVVAAVVHVATHIPAFKRYFSSMVAVSLMVVMVAAGGVMVAAGGSKPSPVRQVVSSVIDAPLSSIAALQGVSSEAVLSKLQSAGYEEVSANLTVKAVAAQRGESPMDLIGVLFAKEP